MTGEHYLTFCTYLSALTNSICDGSFEVDVAVAWSQMVVDVG